MSENEEEFCEIEHSGGLIRFFREDGVLNCEFSQANPWPLKLFQVCVGPNGQLMDTVPITGIGPSPPYPQPSILAYVISDREGMFGRRCPHCMSYFRTDYCDKWIVCPYCARTGHNVHFTTENQAQFIGKYCSAYLEVAGGGRQEETIDLDQVARELPRNRPVWHYAEESLQRLFDCVHCETKFDILGEYGSCPCCARRNWKEVFEEKCEQIEVEFARASESVVGRQERGREWGKLVSSGVSELDALGSEVKVVLLGLPNTPRRLRAVQEFSMQRIARAEQSLRRWYEIVLFEGLSDSEATFLLRMFEKRHLLVHRGGRVDQEYLDATGDTSVRVNQTIRIRSSEVGRFVQLVRQVGQNLICGVLSMFEAGLRGEDGAEG